MNNNNLVNVKYKQTGKSVNVNSLGMREMQERAFEMRNSQYLLIKSPPASGKSRAMMFLGLDKLFNQSIEKLIITVPERIIASSFNKTDLKSFGFFENWNPSEEYNLCSVGSDKNPKKIKKFNEFFKNKDQIMICTHATFRLACEKIDFSLFNNVLIGLDEFHHVSIDDGNVMGRILNSIIKKSNAHIVAMTGSYFRGDAVPILSAEDENKFYKVKYDYYEQLNGYKYLKSLGIGYHFYSGKYIDSIQEVFDIYKKTIIHIPHPNSGESLKDKEGEVNRIIDIIGEIEYQDKDTGVIYIKTDDNKILKVADLVYDHKTERDKIVSYLRNIKKVDDIDIIIALGMAKEGFDWPYCEHVLTCAYRGSLTEIIQIIGRTTRDSSNKTHAQFTNLVAEPDAKNLEVKIAVNNMLKAISASLLMEQVLAPNFKFKSKKSKIDKSDPFTIKIKNLIEPSERVQSIVQSDMSDIQAKILQDPKILKAITGACDTEVMNKILIPRIIEKNYPDESPEDIESLRQQIIATNVIKSSEIKDTGDRRFIRMADKFINVDEIEVDLIDKVNPFKGAFEIISKTVTKEVLKAIRDTIELTRIEMDEETAMILYPKIKDFSESFKRLPSIDSINPIERELAQAAIFLNNEARKNNLI